MIGLLTVKPGNEPEVGQTIYLTAEQRTGKSGNPYTKLTRNTEEYGGSPYTVLKAEKTDFTDSHGNVSFNVEAEPAEGATSAPESAPNTSNGRSGGDNRGEDIARAVAFKEASRQIAARGPGDPNPANVAAAVRELTEHFLPIVKGTGAADPKAEALGPASGLDHRRSRNAQ